MKRISILYPILLCLASAQDYKLRNALGNAHHEPKVIKDFITIRILKDGKSSRVQYRNFPALPASYAGREVKRGVRITIPRPPTRHRLTSGDYSRAMHGGNFYHPKSSNMIKHDLTRRRLSNLYHQAEFISARMAQPHSAAMRVILCNSLGRINRTIQRMNPAFSLVENPLCLRLRNLNSVHQRQFRRASIRSQRPSKILYYRRKPIIRTRVIKPVNVVKRVRPVKTSKRSKIARIIKKKIQLNQFERQLITLKKEQSELQRWLKSAAATAEMRRIINRRLAALNKKIKFITERASLECERIEIRNELRKTSLSKAIRTALKARMKTLSDIAAKYGQIQKTGKSVILKPSTLERRIKGLQDIIKSNMVNEDAKIIINKHLSILRKKLNVERTKLKLVQRRRKIIVSLRSKDIEEVVRKALHMQLKDIEKKIRAISRQMGFVQSDVTRQRQLVENKKFFTKTLKNPMLSENLQSQIKSELRYIGQRLKWFKARSSLGQHIRRLQQILSKKDLDSTIRQSLRTELSKMQVKFKKVSQYSASTMYYNADGVPCGCPGLKKVRREILKKKTILRKKRIQAKCTTGCSVMKQKQQVKLKEINNRLGVKIVKRRKVHLKGSTKKIVKNRHRIVRHPMCCHSNKKYLEAPHLHPHLRRRNYTERHYILNNPNDIYKDY